MFSIFKKSKRKVAVCLAIPYRREHFLEWCSRKSDFFRMMVNQYRTDDISEIWSYYKNTAKLVGDNLQKLKKIGVTIKEECDLNDIAAVTDYDVIIVIAHKQEQPEAIELWNGIVTPNEFADAIPKDFKGTIDLTCCNSRDVLNLLRIRCLEHKHFIARETKTAVDVHICLLPIIVKRYINTTDSDYMDFLSDVYLEAVKNVGLGDSFQPIMLGEERDNRSTIYAPKSVHKGEFIIVQLYIHRPEESETIDIFAKSKDADTTRIAVKSLKIKLEKGDKITARLKIENNDGGDFDIVGGHFKKTEWDGEYETVDFRVKVHGDCKESTCQCTLLLNVRGRCAGEIYFSVKVIRDDIASDGLAVDIDKVRTSDDIRMDAANEIKSLLLERMGKDDTTESEREVLKRCVLLLETGHVKPNGTRNVFIASTGDMKEARKEAQDGIVSLRMNLNPIQYENWNTDTIRPCDKCSKEVMESDYFLLILGGKYGYVEHLLGLSMTQIEYLVAVFSGKPILAFVQKEDTTSIVVDESQKQFISRVMENHLVSEFESPRELKYQVKEALREIIN